MSPKRCVAVLILSCGLLAACTAAPKVAVHYDPTAVRFSGKQALALVAEFVGQFPYRHSGAPNNRLAAEWIRDRMARYGLSCTIDEWEIVNYSQPVQLRNVVCTLPGASPRQILIAAHHDQSPDTVQGADNDASGIAIMLQLAEILASEGEPRYTLTFISTDAEEYGMVGARRYVQTHPDTSNVIAGISLDNLGKRWSNGMDMSPVGQFRGYGPLWLLLAAREAARAANGLWVPQIRTPVDQVLNQAVPVSFMDQGPMVAAGIPALGFATLYAPGTQALVSSTYHTSGDTIDTISADVLEQSGRISESLVRQLLAMDTFPQERGPYLYLDSRQQVLRGVPLWLVFCAFLACFFVGSYFSGPRSIADKLAAWRDALPLYLGLWLPLLVSILLLYVFVLVGLMDTYHLYPATPKDEPIFEPRWPAVILFLVGLAAFLWVGRKLARRYAAQRARPEQGTVKSLALFAVALAGVYILAINPFSLLFLVPVLSWFLVGGRHGLARVVDIVSFLLGGLVVYALLYFFAAILDNGWAILWYLMMMFSIRMISFPTAAAITAIVAAGLSMVVPPPGGHNWRTRRCS